MTELVSVDLDDAGRGLGKPSRDAHVRACLDEPEDAGAWGSAEVLYFRRAATPAELRAVLRDYPGCLVCAAPGSDGTDLLTWRQGAHPNVVRVSRTANDGASPAVRASLLHALLILSAAPAIRRSP